jgi:hypothetical protein
MLQAWAAMLPEWHKSDGLQGREEVETLFIGALNPRYAYPGLRILIRRPAFALDQCSGSACRTVAIFQLRRCTHAGNSSTEAASRLRLYGNHAMSAEAVTQRGSRFKIRTEDSSGPGSRFVNPCKLDQAHLRPGKRLKFSLCGFAAPASRLARVAIAWHAATERSPLWSITIAFGSVSVGPIHCSVRVGIVRGPRYAHPLLRSQGSPRWCRSAIVAGPPEGVGLRAPATYFLTLWSSSSPSTWRPAQDHRRLRR